MFQGPLKPYNGCSNQSVPSTNQPVFSVYPAPSRPPAVWAWLLSMSSGHLGQGLWISMWKSTNSRIQLMMQQQYAAAIIENAQSRRVLANMESFILWLTKMAIPSELVTTAKYGTIVWNSKCMCFATQCKMLVFGPQYPFKVIKGLC